MIEKMLGTDIRKPGFKAITIGNKRYEVLGYHEEKLKTKVKRDRTLLNVRRHDKQFYLTVEHIKQVELFGFTPITYEKQTTTN